MASAPFDYGSLLGSGQALVPNLAEQALKERLAAIQEQSAGAEVVRAQAAAAKVAQEQQQTAQFQAAVAEYQQKPSLEGLRDLMVRFPEMSEALKRAHDSQAEEVKAGDFRAMAQIHDAIRNNRTDLALGMLKQRRDAGEDDPTLGLVIEALESGDPARIGTARQLTRGLLASMGGPEQYSRLYEVDDPKLRNVRSGEVVLDERSGRIAQSPVPEVVSGPGGIYQNDLIPGVPVLGGGVAPTVAAQPPSTGSDAVPRANIKPGSGLSYRDPLYDQLEAPLEAEFKLPPGLLAAIRTRGERTNADRVSPAGARTVYQFTPETRRGFIRNYGVDPWAGPEQAARAAAIHLVEDYKKTGSWDIAVRRYHGGPDTRRWGKQNRAYAQRVGSFDRERSGPPVIRSRQQFERLASGAEFIAPDGSRRRKP